MADGEEAARRNAPEAEREPGWAQEEAPEEEDAEEKLEAQPDEFYDERQDEVDATWVRKHLSEPARACACGCVAISLPEPLLACAALSLSLLVRAELASDSPLRRARRAACRRGPPPFGRYIMLSCMFHRGVL